MLKTPKQDPISAPQPLARLILWVVLPRNWKSHAFEPQRAVGAEQRGTFLRIPSRGLVHILLKGSS